MTILIVKNQNNRGSNKSLECTSRRIITTTISLSLSFVIAGILFLSSIENSNMTVYAQLSSYISNNSTFPNNGSDTDKAPAFLDAYWTNYLSSASSTANNNNSIKKEVGPGDGASTLAVVLVNRGRSDITGVTGYLTLPSIGFKPIPGKNNGTSQSVASAYSIVKAGGTFVLYFDMNVLKQAKVDAYSTSLSLKYTKINQIGQLMTTTTLPFRLTGKVILDAVSENSELTPSTQNQLKILIHNIGSANAAGAVVIVTGITSGSSLTSSNTQSTSSSSSNTSSGNTNTTNSPSSSSSSFSPSSSSNPAANIGATTFHIGTIPANGSAEINPVVYPTASSGETVQNLNLQISYGDAYGNQQISNVPVGLVILPNPPQSVVNATANNGNALIVPAGKIQDIDFTVANSDNKKPITNVVISLASQSGSMKILGDSRWTFQSMLPQSKLNLSTKVYASSDLIGKPALFTLTVDYVSAGQSKTDSLNIGTYVSGNIKIRAYDVGINFIGGTPNLIGNLLNEGNTVGLFTTVDFVKPISGKSFIQITPPSQYLGDLSVDSPLPFSMPLNIDNKTMTTIQPGIYPITLKITYSDDLKIAHVLLVNSSVNFEPKHAPSSSGGGSSGGLIGFGTASSNVIVIIAAIAAVIIFVLVRRRRSKSKRTKLQSSKDVDPFIDDLSAAPADKDLSRDLKKR